MELIRTANEADPKILGYSKRVFDMWKNKFPDHAIKQTALVRRYQRIRGGKLPSLGAGASVAEDLSSTEATINSISRSQKSST